MVKDARTDLTRDSAEANRFRMALVKLRKKKGLRQRDVARLAGINSNTFAAWEQGRAIWQAVTQIARVAAAIGVTPNELFGVGEQSGTDAMLRERLDRIVTVLAHEERHLASITTALSMIVGGHIARDEASSEELLSRRAAAGDLDQLHTVKHHNVVDIEAKRRMHEGWARASAARQEAQRLMDEARANSPKTT